MSDLHRDYLLDVCYELRMKALEAKRVAKESKETPSEAFHTGKSEAYYEVLSHIVNQAKAFGLPLKDLHLQGFDPERELL